MRNILNTKKKGQLSLGNAPTIILIVGLVFLIMATIALVGEKYQDAFPTTSKTNVNETLADVNSVTTSYVGDNSACNFENFAVLSAINISGDWINPANYTTDTSGGVLYSSILDSIYNNSAWNVTYSFDYSGTACNITSDMQTELGSNTSIAGIILTISLVGIVLSILIGVFMGVRRVGSRI